MSDTKPPAAKVVARRPRREPAEGQSYLTQPANRRPR